MGKTPERGQDLGGGGEKERFVLFLRYPLVDGLEHRTCTSHALGVPEHVGDMYDGFKEGPDPFGVPGTSVESALEGEKDRLSYVGKLVHESRRPGAPSVAQRQLQGLAARAVTLLERQRGCEEAPPVELKRQVDGGAVSLDEVPLIRESEPWEEERNKPNLETPAPVGELEHVLRMPPYLWREGIAALLENLELFRGQRDSVNNCVKGSENVGGGELHRQGLLGGGGASSAESADWFGAGARMSTRRKWTDEVATEVRRASYGLP